MRILHVPHAYHPVIGGAELICKKVSEGLVALGHEIEVLTTDAGAVQAYYEFGVCRVNEPNQMVNGVAVKRLKFSGGVYQIGGWMQADFRPRWLGTRVAGRIRHYLYRWLDRQVALEIARFRPDVVMTMPHLVVNVQSVLAARSSINFPLVMCPMLHEHDPSWDIAATAKALRLADAVVALTDHERERLAESYEVAREKIFLASVGIDIPPRVSPRRDRQKRVIYLGRQVKSKGIGDLIDAMRVVWSRHSDAELVIAGIRVPESVEIDTQIAALPHRWRHNVRQLGAVSDAEKADLLRSSCCLVLPSKSESFGMVILEAWSHSTPVIVWDLPVFRSIVDDEENGLLVNPDGGSKALADAIARLLVATAGAEHLGAAGYAKAGKTYTWSNVAAAYLAAYEYARNIAG